MKRVQITVLKSDVNAVIEYLGRHEAMHFVDPSAGEGASVGDANTGAAAAQNNELARIEEQLENLRRDADFLGLQLPAEPEFPSGPEAAVGFNRAQTEKLCALIGALRERDLAIKQEQKRVEETLSEARAFSDLNAPFENLDQLSYLTLRIGHLDPRLQPELKKRLGQRAAIIPLGGADSDRVLAASSRIGRFALDSELKNCKFEPVAIPHGYKGVPAELIEGLTGRLKIIAKDSEQINREKAQLQAENSAVLRRFASLLLMSLAAEKLKSRFVATSNIYMLSGWVPADMITQTAAGLSQVTGGRVAIRVYTPQEIPQVRRGEEKVPVFLKHGAFVKGFQGMVFSYGVPLYGTVDPTPLVAFFFTLLFGIMFGDVGHGFVLFVAGVLTGKRGLKALAKFRHFSAPLIAVSVSSMIMGLLVGSVFTNEELLVKPTLWITGALTGHPVDRILHILPLPEKGGSVTKLFYLFGFTIGIGVIINSLGLLINIFNCFTLKKYRDAFLSKTGLAGLLFFWYALFIGIRCLTGGRFEWFDIAGLVIPAVFIFFSHKNIIEGVMEVWETATGYFSNTASFLRVGAFALSHAVLAYIVFYFTEDFVVHTGGLSGWFWGVFLMLFGNSLIIVLEGLIVSIQVLRLQYYEFFGKFFTEKGELFVPFRFRNIGV